MTPRDILKKYWGYDDFRPLQLDIIDSVLSGHDTLGLLPTGGGKSITFQVPAMLLPDLTIVVTPLISLMKDQVDNLRARNIRAYALHTGLTRQESRLVIDRCRLGKVKLLYISPERLQSGTFIDELRTWQISLIVVDEAHCISQWGYDFRPSYLKIDVLRTIFPAAPVLALTASATPAVADDIRRQLNFRPGARTFAKSFDRDNLSYVVRYDEYKDRSLLRVLNSVPGTGIVYVRSRRRCREIANTLIAAGITAEYYHAGLDPNEKEEKQNAWISGQVRVMVATNAFGMGIDKPDVRVVVHYDPPSSLEEYYQEAGRAGRDGQPSYAVMIVAGADKALLTRRLNDSFPPKEYICRVYDLVGVFLDVAVGDGYNQVYEFNYNLFCVRFGLQPWLAYSALQILTRAKYIEYIDEVATRARVMIIAKKHELYSLTLDDVTDRIFSALQREYTGLFTDYVHIDEHRVAARAGVTDNQVYDAMLLLSRKKVVSYVPRKSTPYIYFTTSREESRYLLLPKDVYEDRRRAMEERIDAMKHFMFDTSGCRSQVILNYFGESNAVPCGRCDLCRSTSRNVSEKQFSNIIEQVRALAGMAPEQILQRFPATMRDAVIEAIREISDE